MIYTHIDCHCGARYMQKRDACPECGGPKSSKGIHLVLSAAAFKHLETIIQVAGMAMSDSPTVPILERILDDMRAEKKVCLLKTAKERRS